MVGSPAHRPAEKNKDIQISSAMVQVLQMRLADPVQNKTGFKLGIGQQLQTIKLVFTYVCVAFLCTYDRFSL